jgi:hypothetical protein
MPVELAHKLAAVAVSEVERKCRGRLALGRSMRTTRSSGASRCRSTLPNRVATSVALQPSRWIGATTCLRIAVD